MPPQAPEPTGAPGNHTAKKKVMYARRCYTIDVLHLTYPRQHHNESPT